MFWLNVTLTLKIANHIQFGYKRFGGKEVMSGQTFIKMFNLNYNFDLKHSNELFPQDSLLRMMYHQTRAKGSAVQKISANSHILII